MSAAPPNEQPLLLVDDDDVLRERLARALRERDLEVITAHDFDSAMEAARAHDPERAVIDLRMPGRHGLELLLALRQEQPALRVIVLTGYGSIATTVEAMRLGAIHYVQKPADADEILAAFDAPRIAAETIERDEHQTPSLARAEWEHINRVLNDCGGNISEAARRLGMHRRSLQRKLQKYPPRQ